MDRRECGLRNPSIQGNGFLILLPLHDEKIVTLFSPIGNFYYNRYNKGELEQDTSNMKIYAIKRYTNEFKIFQLGSVEHVQYTQYTIFKTWDYTNDYSEAVKILVKLKEESKSNTF
jgi:predicted transcriptional regulator with HTH domain